METSQSESDCKQLFVCFSKSLSSKTQKWSSFEDSKLQTCMGKFSLEDCCAQHKFT